MPVVLGGGTWLKDVNVISGGGADLVASVAKALDQVG
jgi:hypothetical protein